MAPRTDDSTQFQEQHRDEASDMQMPPGQEVFTDPPTESYDHLLEFMDTVKLLVGSGTYQRIFIVHTARIRGRSSFLTAACSDRWASSGAKKDFIDLTGEMPLIMDLYVDCIYSDEVRLGDFFESLLQQPTDPHYSFNDEILIRLIRLYILADKLGDCKTANLVMDSLVGWVVGDGGEDAILPLPSHMSVAFEATTEDSPLRRLICDKLMELDLAELEVPEEGYYIPQEAVAETERLRARVADGELKGYAERAEYDERFVRQFRDGYHQYDDLHPRPRWRDSTKVKEGSDEEGEVEAGQEDWEQE